MEYLGHIGSDEGVTIDPTKIQAIVNWPTPRNVKELKGVFGFDGLLQEVC